MGCVLRNQIRCEQGHCVSTHAYGNESVNPKVPSLVNTIDCTVLHFFWPMVMRWLTPTVPSRLANPLTYYITSFHYLPVVK